jgi:hypothetical protein
LDSFLENADFLLIVFILLHQFNQPFLHGTNGDRMLFVLLLEGLNVLFVLLVPVLGL